MRKRCRDCKRMQAGTPGRLEWCDCGGELAVVRFTPQSRRRGTSGGHKPSSGA